MKVFVALACFIVCAQASYIASGWNAAPAQITTKLLSTGTSQSSRTQDAAGNYAFSYNEQHNGGAWGLGGGSSRQESGNGWGAKGSYSLNVGDGRQRTVTYVADGAGFRAAISTNEPGTAAQPAADTSISSPYAAPEPVKALPVPVALPEPAAAPVLALPALPALNAWSTPNAWNTPAAWAPAPEPVKVVAAVPATSSYSTSINHAAPAAYAVAEPAAVPVVQAKLSGWN